MNELLRELYEIANDPTLECDDRIEILVNILSDELTFAEDSDRIIENYQEQ